jgi:hypothetical protein
MMKENDKSMKPARNHVSQARDSASRRTPSRRKVSKIIKSTMKDYARTMKKLS